MSTTEATPARPGEFLRAEVASLFARRRNAVLLALVAAIPVALAAALHRSPDTVIDGGRAGVQLAHGAASGVHVALAGLLVSMPLLLPLTVAVVAGEAIAGEAQAGTLRYLLTVPVGRTRLLLTKYAAVVGWSAAATAASALAGAAAGFALFPGRSIRLLTGGSVSLVDGLARLLLAAGYVTVMLAAFAAIGIFVSTVTDSPLAAMTATVGVAVVGQVVETLPGVAAVRPWLPTHYWPLFVDVLSGEPFSGRLEHGLLTQAAGAALFLTLAWAQFGARDIRS